MFWLDNDSNRVGKSTNGSGICQRHLLPLDQDGGYKTSVLSWLSGPSFQELLQRAVSKTEGYEVYQLEKLYALLCQSIYRHRKDYDKTALLKVCHSIHFNLYELVKHLIEQFLSFSMFSNVFLFSFQEMEYEIEDFS